MTKILLVEDDKSLREIYGVRLLAEGYDIVSAGDGEQALAMAIKERPQLIVSDVMMPKISGFDMLDILRSTTETKDIKVIMMTALSSEDQRARGQALGADRYLVKSQVGIEDVVRTVHEVLADAPVSGQPFPPRNIAATPPPRPAPSTPPQRPPLQPQPAQQPTPTFNSAPQPARSSGLPQPTAPFSTTRPANLGERVIHPISQPTTKPDISSLMDQELNQSASAPTPTPIPVTPTLPQPPAIQQPTPPPAPTPEPQAAPTPPKAPDISFEETPRPPAPTAPFTPGSQPPQA
jgi:CheY-like chemotaxis protein